MKRFDPHNHTEYSNIRLLDCINKIPQLVDRAVEIGLSGIAITDHECLSGHVKANQYCQKIQEQYPDFKVALGNEIYLCENREKGQKYYHFILIAKNATGHKALRELSSIAWLNSFEDRRIERVVTTYADLVDVVKKYPNSLIAETACLGGFLSSKVLELIELENNYELAKAYDVKKEINNFISLNKYLFKDDFYIEVAPGCSKEQIAANKRLKKIADFYKIKVVIGCDAHYLKKEDRYVHKSYLNSKNGEREVDAFYEYAYLQTEEEIIQNLSKSLPNQYQEFAQNSMEIYNKIENYTLFHKQTIPKIFNFPLVNSLFEDLHKYPILDGMNKSDNEYERYWVNACVQALKEKKLYNDTYLERLEYEADIKKTIGEKLETNMFAYPVTLQHYIDLFWECGSLVGTGRGSSCAGLNHFLLGITHLDPIKWNLPFYRYLNKERVELGSLLLMLPSCKKRL